MNPMLAMSCLEVEEIEQRRERQARGRMSWDWSESCGEASPDAASKRLVSRSSSSRKRAEYISAVRPPESTPSSGAPVLSMKVTSVDCHILSLLKPFEKCESTEQQRSARLTSILHGLVRDAFVCPLSTTCSTYCRKARKRGMKSSSHTKPPLLWSASALTCFSASMTSSRERSLATSAARTLWLSSGCAWGLDEEPPSVSTCVSTHVSMSTSSAACELRLFRFRLLEVPDPAEERGPGPRLLQRSSARATSSVSAFRSSSDSISGQPSTAQGELACVERNENFLALISSTIFE